MKALPFVGLFRLAVFVLLSGLVLLTPVQAQVLYGTVVGDVTDQSGAVVPNAAVTITNTATGVTRDSKTDDGGRYSIGNALPGTYDLKVTVQ